MSFLIDCSNAAGSQEGAKPLLQDANGWQVRCDSIAAGNQFAILLLPKITRKSRHLQIACQKMPVHSNTNSNLSSLSNTITIPQWIKANSLLFDS